MAFPCNQFGKQEPGVEAEIKAFAQRSGATFPMFAKVDVNGTTAHPLFLWLQSSLKGFITDAIKWNFTKFLLVDGVPRARYGTKENPLGTCVDRAVVDARTSNRWRPVVTPPVVHPLAVRQPDFEPEIVKAIEEMEQKRAASGGSSGDGAAPAGTA